LIFPTIYNSSPDANLVAWRICGMAQHVAPYARAATRWHTAQPPT